MSVEETILLQFINIQADISIKINNCISNVIYLKLSADNHRIIHTILLIDKPHLVWRNIIEQFEIKIDLLIDSHKGIGILFDKNSCLYQDMIKTSIPHLLTKYYFKGKYIS